MTNGLSPTTPRPDSVRGVDLPRRQHFHPSPAQWRDEVLYFLLPDRFSDGNESPANLLARANIPAARGANWDWSKWTESGKERYQGGTLRGITSKLAYIAGLGATTVWVGPVFKQRGHLDGTYHGYGVQDFLEVDPHLGTRQDLVDLVAAAHQAKLRVILDVVFNHSGNNWVYADGQDMPPYEPWPRFREKGEWRGGNGGLIPKAGGAPLGPDDAVWPAELQDDDDYTRAGFAGLGGEDIDDPHAAHKRTDFFGLRDFNLDNPDTIDDLARCYKYWIALTDCDGFRLDTLKHVSQEDGRNFCGAVKEFAANLGKDNFFLVGEVGGPDGNAQRYLDVLERNLSATLDIGGLRTTLTAVGKGFAPPGDYLGSAAAWNGILGSHRLAGERHVTVLDDHDHVFGEKVRFSSDGGPTQAVAAIAVQLFSLGIPCIYYGTEQAFSAPERPERQWLSNFGGEQAYLREAMFGPTHPRNAGSAGLPAAPSGVDTGLPGFGPFGTAGFHCFDPTHPVYVRVAHLAAARHRYPVLRAGRQYQRGTRNFDRPFAPPDAGEVFAWARVLDDEEACVVVNGNGGASRGADIWVDLRLALPVNPAMQVVANSAQAEALATGTAYTGPHPVGQQLPVVTRGGSSFVEIRDLPASECLVLLSRSDMAIPVPNGP